MFFPDQHAEWLFHLAHNHQLHSLLPDTLFCLCLHWKAFAICWFTHDNIGVIVLVLIITITIIIILLRLAPFLCFSSDLKNRWTSKIQIAPNPVTKLIVANFIHKHCSLSSAIEFQTVYQRPLALFVRNAPIPNQSFWFCKAVCYLSSSSLLLYC